MNLKVQQTADALKLSMATALFLAIVKLATSFLTHSMAIMASSLDSFMDVATSLVNFIAAREASKPPDDDHAYGHGKIESLASLFQSLIVGISGLIIIWESVKRLLRGSFIQDPGAGIGVMIFSILATWILIWRLQVVAQRNQSLILATERLHFTSDILANGGAIAALLLVMATHFAFWDLAASILVSFFIFKTSYKIFRRAVDELLDKSLPPVSKDEIDHLIRNFNPSIVGIHNFRSRKVGDQVFMDFHIEIRGEDNFKRAHLMTESLIQKIGEQYPGADITVHFDPEGEM